MSDEVEDAFDELSVWVAAELARTRGDANAERATLEETVRRYAELRKQVNPEEPWSYVTHFLNADGVAFERAREPAFARIAGATAAERKRWCDVAGEIARALEAKAFGG